MPLFARYHLFLVVCNRSTLEQFRAPIMAGSTSEDKFAWNLGRLRNLQQVFGSNPARALLPVRSTPGDGLHYPRSRSSLARQQQQMQQAQQQQQQQPVAVDNNGGLNGSAGTTSASKDHISVAIDTKLGISDVYV